MCIERIFIQNLHFLLCNGYTNSFRVWWYKVTPVFVFVFFSFFFIFFSSLFPFFYFNLHSSSKDMRDILWVKRICENVRKLLRSNRNSTVRPCTNIELIKPDETKTEPEETLSDSFNHGQSRSWITQVERSRKRSCECLTILRHFENREGLGEKMTDLQDIVT